MQSNIAFLPLTFDDHHNLSVTEDAGETYLVLEHSDHSHHHGHMHRHDGMTSHNHHDHGDHLIKLSKVQLKISTAIKSFELEKHQQINNYVLSSYPIIPWMESSSELREAIPKRCRGPAPNHPELTNSIQFLV